MAIEKTSNFSRMNLFPYSFNSSLKTVYALSGFLGAISDWDLFSARGFGVNSLISLSPTPDLSLENWGKSCIPSSNTQNILMGYSLGGRLALHALLARPDFWHAAIFISTHSGLSDPKAREERICQDQIWADRFLSEPWENLLKDWNRQPVLAMSNPIERLESHYCRLNLAQTLKTWSLGLQQDLKIPLSQIRVPILWVVGEKDTTYTKLSQTLTFAHPLSLTCSIVQSGHRVPWDAPKTFQKCVHDWIQKL